MYSFRYWIKKNIKKIFIFGFLKNTGIIKILSKWEQWKWREHKKLSWRFLNRGKQIYVIRRQDSTCGLFSYFITMLGGIAYAEQNGMVPVVDLQNHQNIYLSHKEVGKKNVWEFYFLQPGGVSLKEALKCNNVIMGSGNPTYSYPCLGKSFFENENGILDYWRGICKKSIRFNKTVENRLQKEKLIFQGKRILGVLCRGTDYVSMRPKGHPIQPSAEMVMDKVDQTLKKENFDAVYLVTEDWKIVSAFKQKYGSKLLLSKQDYIEYDYDKRNYLAAYYEDKQDGYNRGLDYLIALLLLIDCNGLITTMTSGSVGVMCLAKDYDFFYVFDLGYY